MRTFGFTIETLALEYLNAYGFKLICRNFHCRQGEIDLIGILQKQLIFVEVRFRRNFSYGTATESVTANKQKRLIHTAQVFLKKTPQCKLLACRFDVIAITIKNKDYVIEWVQNAFQSP